MGSSSDGSKLRRHGFPVVPFGQGFKDMSPPTKELMKLTLEENSPWGSSVLRWMMDNIFIRTDPAGSKADKEKSHPEKIDGVIATILMALDRAIRCGNDTSESVYDRGLLVF